MNEFKQKLVDIKAKVTRPRLLILKALHESKQAISAVEIIRKTRLDKATVYRSLDLFIENDLVKSIDLRQGKKLYEIKKECSHHYIICLKCQKIRKIDICIFKQIKKEVLNKSKFKQINDHSLEFFGICRNCYEN